MSYYTIHTQKYSPVLFYEYMFWGGGHVLQLAFSQTLLLVYLIILEQKSKFLKGTTVNIIFIVNTLSTIFTPLVYICAILLFNYGGILGILSIQGNVTIPAHYHGSIVGMTIAFMGLIYWIIPKIGFYKINTTIANIQIYTYSLGQFLHITGLELLGGYGAIRKVTHLPDTASKIAQHCFTFGGLMAIIGGCLFVILVLLQVCKKRSHI
ncbi:putative integral membrane protein [Ehrlichia ruminantium]|uniref:Putative integral membrane protein n=2 Tax=Ehrlichia ruminantium TaxID=779 RepID=A0A170TJQ0_EHRRU|nr:putative integral membrane protein [Ehrlichia ruminantium]